MITVSSAESFYSRMRLQGAHCNLSTPSNTNPSVRVYTMMCMRTQV